MPLNDFTGWQFTRQSGQTVPDGGGVDRTVGVDEVAIVGGDWDGTTLVDGPNAVGIGLVLEDTDYSGTTAITQAATHAAATLYDLAGRHRQDLFVMHVQFDVAQDGTVFAMANGAEALVTVTTSPTNVTVTVGNAVHVHPVTGPVYDIRIRKSTLTTTWVNNYKIQTLDTPPLDYAVITVLSGVTQHTDAVGTLMRADYYPTAMTEPDVEALPGV